MAGGTIEIGFLFNKIVTDDWNAPHLVDTNKK